MTINQSINKRWIGSPPQSYNQLTGEIPNGEARTASRDAEIKQRSWSDVGRLKSFLLDHNQIQGTIPEDLPTRLGSSLLDLDLGANRLTGTIPSTVGKMTKLELLDVHGNQLTGRLPPEMNRMYPDVQLNLTDN